ncbi:MAG: nitrous oxide reductase accessory protein NosL [Flavitalea sp.]
MFRSLSNTTRILSLLAALALIAVIFLPIWRIELSAPQYPEGLVLKIFADELGGDVAVINGLNHYIGMRTLHTEDFIGFTVLPYIIGALSLFGLLTFIINRRWFFFTWAGFFILFGIVSMIDFYRWNYNYGHNLDPTAPIQVPGMTYQPPLIGYKQLLNFGAYSIPDAGGWIFILVGLIIVLGLFLEIRGLRKSSLTVSPVSSILLLIPLFLTSCSSGPRPIKVGEDACTFCKMTVTDKKFGAELVTDKGKVFVYDDLHCLAEYVKQNPDLTNSDYYVTSFESGDLIKSDKAVYLKSELLKSPMGSNIAAFSSAESMNKFSGNYPGEVIQWNKVMNH